MAGSRYSDAETTEGGSLLLLLLLRGRNEYFLARSWENDLEEALFETYQSLDSLRRDSPHLGNLGPMNAGWRLFVTLSSRSNWDQEFLEFENVGLGSRFLIVSIIVKVFSRCLISIGRRKNIYFSSMLDIDFINAKIHREIHSVDNTIYPWNRKFSTVILKSPNFAHSYEISPPLRPNTPPSWCGGVRYRYNRVPRTLYPSPRLANKENEKAEGGTTPQE